jgi:hypothetical protein
MSEWAAAATNSTKTLTKGGKWITILYFGARNSLTLV